MTARRKKLREVVDLMGDDDRVAVVVALNKFAQGAGEESNTTETHLLASRSASQLLEE